MEKQQGGNWYAQASNPNPARFYLISYDLKKDMNHYDALEKALKDAGALMVLESAWVLESTASSALQVFEQFKGHLHLVKGHDETEKMFVVEIGPNKNGWLWQDGWDYLPK